MDYHGHCAMPLKHQVALAESSCNGRYQLASWLMLSSTMAMSLFAGGFA